MLLPYPNVGGGFLYPIIDAHCDTITELTKRGESLAENSLAVSLSKLKRYPGFVQLFAIWLSDTSKSPFEEALFFIDRFYEEMTKNKQDISPVFSGKEIEKVLFSGKIGALLTVENGNCLEGKLHRVELLYRLGVRALTLTWNGENELGCGVEARDGGLSAFGREVVYEMNRLGMLIDVSHLSERGFWEVLSLTKAPLMASHSNAKSICSHKRNLTDEQILAIAKEGGVVGLNFYPPFLSNSGEADLEDCMAHIDRIMSVGGENCLGLGSDFDGFSEPKTEEMASPDGYKRLFLKLSERGFSEKLLKKLAYGNFLRLFQEVLR